MEIYIVVFIGLLLVLSIYYFLSKESGPPRALTNPRVQKAFKLTKKDQISHDTYIFRFGLPSAEMVLGIKVGEHILVHKKEMEDGKEINISRKYTPISTVDQKGYFDLLIKIYRANENPKFPAGGKVTPYIESLKIGDSLNFSGPKGKFNYLGNGKVLRKDEGTKTFKKIAFIAGGTGITPMYQVMQAVLSKPEDKTNLTLLFANKSEKDILLRSELEAMGKDKRVSVYFSLDEAGEGWNGFTGFIDEEKLKKTLPEPSNDLLICTCGPPMLNKLLRDLLKKMGYNMEDLFKF